MSDDINIGQITEALNDKMDRDGNNIESPKLPVFLVAKQDPTAENGYTWYRLYSDNWVEQGGAYTGSTNDTNVANGITFLKPFADTNYFAMITCNSTNTTVNTAQPDWIYGRSTTSMSVHIDSYTNGTRKDWMACGKAA